MRLPTPLTLLLLATMPAGPAAETTRLLRFDLRDDGSIVVPVTINGGGPFRFMLDTGSTRSAVSEELARRLQLAPVANSVMVTPSGRGLRALARINGFSLAETPPLTLDAIVLPTGDFGARSRLDGLVGQDVLASFVYTIDYTRRAISWGHELPRADERTRLQLDSAAGRFLVSLPQPSSAARPLRFIPDTGADGIVLFARTSRPPLPVTPLDVGLVRTLSGHKLVRRVLVDDLRVGDVMLRNQTALLVPADASEALLGDGLLPLHLFARVAFNGPGHYLVVEGRD